MSRCHPVEGIPVSDAIPPLARTCKKVHAEFLPVHRRLTTHHVCVEDFEAYTKVAFPTESVRPETIAKYEGTICVGFPWPQEIAAHYTIFELQPLLHFFARSCGVRATFESVTSVPFFSAWNGNSGTIFEHLETLLRRDTPLDMQWLLDPYRVGYKLRCRLQMPLGFQWFVADPGTKLLSVDYYQSEKRDASTGGSARAIYLGPPDDEWILPPTEIGHFVAAEWLYFVHEEGS